MLHTHGNAFKPHSFSDNTPIEYLWVIQTLDVSTKLHPSQHSYILQAIIGAWTIHTRLHCTRWTPLHQSQQLFLFLGLPGPPATSEQLPLHATEPVNIQQPHPQFLPRTAPPALQQPLVNPAVAIAAAATTLHHLSLPRLPAPQSVPRSAARSMCRQRKLLQSQSDQREHHGATASSLPGWQRTDLHLWRPVHALIHPLGEVAVLAAFQLPRHQIPPHQCSL